MQCSPLGQARAKDVQTCLRPVRPRVGGENTKPKQVLVVRIEELAQANELCVSDDVCAVRP